MNDYKEVLTDGFTYKGEILHIYPPLTTIAHLTATFLGMVLPYTTHRHGFQK